MGTTLWISGEIQLDMDEEHRSARKDVEDAANVVFGSSNYGEGLNKWYWDGSRGKRDEAK
jgi:hypothetical protein